MTPIATSDPTPELVNVKAICQSLLEAVAARATAQRVTVDVALAPEPAWVVAIPGLIRGALHRLMLRALRAMPAGGTLSILVQRRGGVVAIELADSGFDISANLRAVRVVLRAIGGTLTRALHDGRGTRFLIEIPAAVAERQVLAPPCKDGRVAPLGESPREDSISAPAL